MKYILVTGGVLSGIGKGVIASSTGVLLKSLGFRVTSIKIDPYINIDAGTMSPYEHGEVFVLDDGGEVDLDLGNYERFIGCTLKRDNNITTGKIYNSVIEKEREGKYLGKTVQVVPHITDAIQDWVQRVAHDPVDGLEGPCDVCVIELGGTVGDIESMPFIEAMRQFQFRVGKENFCLLHVSLVPVVGAVGEQKSKPTQQSVRELRALGLNPDVIVCRSSAPLEPSIKEKIASFCHVPQESVISVHDVSNIYRVPLMLQPQGLTAIMTKVLQIHPKISEPNLKGWHKLADRYDNILLNKNIKGTKIAVVGKYTHLSDAYLSLTKAITHAALKTELKVIVVWIEATHLEDSVKTSDPTASTQAWEALLSADGILVPGGFGDRGIEGKIKAIEYARVNKKPFLGICLGMQMAVVEIARNVMGWTNATSEEFDANAERKVIIYMPEISKTHMGGNMRLGMRRTLFKQHDCLTSKLYSNPDFVEERHRHRYEVNPTLVPEIEKNTKMRFVGQDETGNRMEIVELADHPFFVGVQYHPEFKSRPLRPSPPFVGLLLASAGCFDSWMEKKKVGVDSPLSKLNLSLEIEEPSSTAKVLF
eukprot:TRINITY_DN1578_c0_g1_i2.p1 TRINITY_DN1578_c0_g1~~TRINITY_DN1578_c0_g1_i2.p1  ORF type:complete len:615 (-),score=171.56 TRINITY_DN1578_c0_g1_i2:965-2740(-)